MCTNEAPAAAVVLQDLLAAPPGPTVIAALDDLDLAVLDHADRLVVLEIWERQQAWLTARTLPAVVAVAGTRPADEDDFVREELRAVLHLSRTGAQDRLEVARALSTTLAATRRALEAGDLGYLKARVLVELVRNSSAAVARAVEAEVLVRAPHQTVGEFRAACSKALLRADPTSVEEQHQRAKAGRAVTSWPEEAGMATVSATLTADGARTVMLALDAVARGQGDPTLPVDARRADALVRLCEAALADPSLPRQHGRPVTLQVVVDLPTLLGLASHPGELLGYGAIPACLARSLAADATWQRLLVERGTGRLLHVGSTRYRPGRVLREFLTTRSRTCTFPTCHTPATACDLDHAHPFDHAHPAAGGLTSATNCHPACRRHHRLKTHGGWTVRTEVDGSVTWSDPTGRRFTTPPADHRPVDDPPVSQNPVSKQPVSDLGRPRARSA
jgi:hypothetical protein